MSINLKTKFKMQDDQIYVIKILDDGTQERILCDIAREIADQINAMPAESELKKLVSGRGGGDKTTPLYFEFKPTAEAGKQARNLENA